MKSRGVIIGFCAILMTIIFVAAVSAKEEKPRITVVVKELDIEYWKVFEAGVKKAFKEFGVDGKVIAPSSETMVDEQIKVLETELIRHPDALIVAPSQPSAVIPILQEYSKKNIPVLLADTDSDWTGKTAYIGTDNFELGRKGGALLASMLHPGDKVAIINGSILNPILDVRLRGAQSALKEAGMEIVLERKWTSDHDEKRLIEALIAKHPDIQGVFAVQDGLALEALNITEKRGLKIPVVGADGIKEMVHLIETGKLTGTVAQNPYDMGYLSVETALKAINGETVEKEVDSGVDIITEDNAKEKLKFLAQILK